MNTEVLRALVKLADDAPGSLTVQIEDLEPDDPDDELEVLEPIGVHFLPSLDEDMAVFEVNGSADNRFVALASQRGHRPQDLTAAGSGGLHFLGAWRVFLDDDGTLHLGERDAPDWVALASLVLAELQDVKADLDGFKSTFDNHIHVTTATVGLGPAGTIAPTLTLAPTPHTPASVASEVIKAV